MSVRVRFAPSPTGYLHIGGARTALFNWLYARRTGGTFILRIEDTDAARNTAEAVEVILDGLRWLGLDWDEGPISSEPGAEPRGQRGPYFQSQRGALYRERVEWLKSKGWAYENEGAVRFRMPREPIMIQDAIVGEVRRELTDREQVDPDFVLVRSDGQPVFHLVNVVDDLEMQVTHVIRGEDHLSNTAKHIALFRAFGVTPPVYAHIPLILNADGSKMSKRDLGASLSAYIAEDYLPAAVVNYLCLLGWSPKDNREKLSLDEVVQRFELERVLRHNARFDMTKLQWLNGEYLRELPAEDFRKRAAEALRSGGLDPDFRGPAYRDAALDSCRGKIRLFSELSAYAGFYFVVDPRWDAQLLAKEFTPECRSRIAELRSAFSVVSPFEAAGLEVALKETARRLGVKNGVLVHPVRLACTGTTAGPGLYQLLEILGRDEVLKRVDRALECSG